MASNGIYKGATLYSYKVWGKDIIPFLHLNSGPVWRTKIDKVRWLYIFYGCYFGDSQEDQCKLKLDRVRLERMGFKRIELVEMDV